MSVWSCTKTSLRGPGKKHDLLQRLPNCGKRETGRPTDAKGKVKRNSANQNTGGQAPQKESPPAAPREGTATPHRRSTTARPPPGQRHRTPAAPEPRAKPDAEPPAPSTGPSRQQGRHAHPQGEPHGDPPRHHRQPAQAPAARRPHQTAAAKASRQAPRSPPAPKTQGRPKRTARQEPNPTQTSSKHHSRLAVGARPHKIGKVPRLTISPGSTMQNDLRVRPPQGD